MDSDKGTDLERMLREYGHWSPEICADTDLRQLAERRRGVEESLGQLIRVSGARGGGLLEKLIQEERDWAIRREYLGLLCFTTRESLVHILVSLDPGRLSVVEIDTVGLLLRDLSEPRLLTLAAKIMAIGEEEARTNCAAFLINQDEDESSRIVARHMRRDVAVHIRAQCASIGLANGAKNRPWVLRALIEAFSDQNENAEVRRRALGSLRDMMDPGGFEEVLRNQDSGVESTLDRVTWSTASSRFVSGGR